MNHVHKNGFVFQVFFGLIKNFKLFCSKQPKPILPMSTLLSLNYKLNFELLFGHLSVILSVILSIILSGEPLRLQKWCRRPK
jgi:hypothetical protein